jgi:hypothetical protein
VKLPRDLGGAELSSQKHSAALDIAPYARAEVIFD